MAFGDAIRQQIEAQFNAQIGPKPEMTPGENGYQSKLEQTDWGTNPWDGIGTEQAVESGTKQGQQNISQMGNKLSSLYPTFQNSMGLGTGTAYQAQSPAQPTSNNTGMNPWSLQGEALTRK